jgi:hypothetical protein
MQASPQTRRRHAHLALAAALSLAGLGAALLYFFPPDRYGFYPRCPVYALTGWECPGCGMTRALAALVRGHATEASHWNPLVFAVVPGAIAWFAVAWRRAMKGEPQTWPRVSSVQLGVAIAALAVFTVGRNLL